VSSRSASLLVTAGLIVSACVFAISQAPFRGIFALPLVLFLPGYALVRLVFARREIGSMETVLLGVGLSMSISALSGLLLHLTPWGVQVGSLATWLGGLSLVFLGLAWLRRIRLQNTLPRTQRFRLRVRDGLFLAATAGVLWMGVSIIRQPAPAQSFQGYTLVWALPYEQGGPGAFKVVVRSQEFTPVEYHLRIESGGRVLAAYPVIELQPGESWEQVEYFSRTQSGDRPVEVSLYRLDDPNNIYRRVVLWVED
jgi:hypothetical protein